jgi:hypothetical protein
MATCNHIRSCMHFSSRCMAYCPRISILQDQYLELSTWVNPSAYIYGAGERASSTTFMTVRCLPAGGVPLGGCWETTSELIVVGQVPGCAGTACGQGLVLHSPPASLLCPRIPPSLANSSLPSGAGLLPPHLCSAMGTLTLCGIGTWARLWQCATRMGTGPLLWSWSRVSLSGCTATCSLLLQGKPGVASAWGAGADAACMGPGALPHATAARNGCNRSAPAHANQQRGPGRSGEVLGYRP